MIRRLPVIATLVVLAAVAVMLRLGFWQLERKAEKESLIARHVATQGLSAEVPWPAAAQAEQALYRRARLVCAEVMGRTAIAGLNVAGESGQAQVADCRLADGRTARVVLGWSRNPAPPAWSGGEVTGWIAPGPRLVADPPLAGLAANARPDPRDIPNNHLSYAVQWFLFAASALVIYGLALRKRLAQGAAPR
jgi:cytochrome oxidase assembly protein ShyY1